MEAERPSGRDGFVLPIVIAALLVMSLSMIAALLSADDEGRSARAMRESSTAFYAAEAGMHAVYAGWNDIAGIDSLDPGESIAQDWQALPSGSSYRATIHRFDDGVQPIYQLEVEGKGPGINGGKRLLTLTLTSAPGGPGEAYSLGDCCEGAVTVRGRVDMEDDTGIDGHDIHPPGWTDEEGVCQDSLYDKPGIVMQDTTQIRFNDPTAWIDGEPPIVQQPDLSDASWDSLGGLDWGLLKDMKEKTFHDGTFRPRPSTKIVDGEVVCDTDDPLNLGSPDPNHPCFTYFPIVEISDDVTFEYGYAQGIFVLDWDPSTMAGSEFDLEIDFTLAGLILGKGCVEPEENSRTYGAIFVDARYRNHDICNTDYDYDMNDGDATVQYSTCAIDRALKYSGLIDWAEPSVSGGSGGVQFLANRSFGEAF